MTLVKTSLLNAIAVVVKMLALLSLNKILAIYVGPAGYAALGQFQNAIQMITTFASGAINTGVIKYTAEYSYNEEKQRLIWRTAGTISLIGSILTSVLVVCFNELLAKWFLKDVNLATVFNWFAASLIFFVFNTLLLAILNGKKEVLRYVIANITGSLISLLITSIMAFKFGLYGALVSIATYQSLSFFATFFLCFKSKWFVIRDIVGSFDKPTALNFMKYTAMALTSAAIVPISHIFIRGHLGEALGWEAAGYWEAIWRLSSAYLMLVTSTLSVYYLPRLSELKDKGAIREEVLRCYKYIFPVVVIFSLMIYFFRDFIIEILFSKDFSPMRDLFAWQMIGDSLKIAGWILAYLMLSKALTRMFILTEVTFSLIFIILTFMFTSTLGIVGVTVAHTVNYFLYFFTMVFMRSRLL